MYNENINTKKMKITINRYPRDNPIPYKNFKQSTTS